MLMDPTSTSQAVVSEPAALQLSFTTTPAACGNTNGEITSNGSGGTAPFQYSLNGGTSQSGNIFSNILAGNYNVTVVDDHGCTYTESVVVNDLAYEQ